MKLSFLGQPYEATLNAAEAIHAQERITSLGQRYKQMPFSVTQFNQPVVELTFLGQRYVR